MRPGDKFSIVNSDKTSFDDATFSKLYLPILGKTSCMLYQLLRVTSSGKMSNLMEYLNVGQRQLEHAFDKLRAISLLHIYDCHSDFQFLLRSPRNFEDFLADDLLVQLLVKKIGKENVANFLSTNEIEGNELKVRFSDVFMSDLQEEFTESPAMHQTSDFDLMSFKSLMAQRKYAFSDENKDILHLYSMSEKFGLDWYGLFKLAEATANADRTLNTDAMIRRYIADNEKKPELKTQAAAELAQVAKSASPQDFLTQLKRQVGGFVSQDEMKLLSNFSKQKMTPEVQNVLIHYTLIREKNPTLTPAFVNKIANDWLRNGITTAEAAIAHIEEFDKKAKKISSAGRKKTVKAEPAWSNPDYNETATDEEVAAFKKELEAMGKGG
ncbi:MAG: DnaD domain protein [Streptococcaceae bacterium]|jgi:replication initiation and membrane attachment protein|nr:DnaD domain protein [Streptococcaceae bacterium]